VAAWAPHSAPCAETGSPLVLFSGAVPAAFAGGDPVSGTRVPCTVHRCTRLAPRYCGRCRLGIAAGPIQPSHGRTVTFAASAKWVGRRIDQPLHGSAGTNVLHAESSSLERWPAPYPPRLLNHQPPRLGKVAPDQCCHSHSLLASSTAQSKDALRTRRYSRCVAPLRSRRCRHVPREGRKDLSMWPRKSGVPARAIWCEHAAIPRQRCILWRE
jgi:hypothetical protein